MENNVKQFLESIQELKPKKFKTFQNSIEKDVSCFPLTFKQQKDLIATIADGTLGVLKFQKILNDILVENTEKEDLLIIDKIPIILKMRFESIGKTLKIENEEYDITNCVENSQKFQNYEKSHTIKGAVTVELKTPSLKEENKVLTYAIEFFKREGDKNLGKNIGNIYTFEIVKFIDSIKFGDQTLLFSEIPVKDRVNVVESLPLTINKEIVKFIEKLKNIDKELLKINVNEEEKEFDIDVTFFDN
jgi:hypothetical protein